jgi:hypothetical protein
MRTELAISCCLQAAAAFHGPVSQQTFATLKALCLRVFRNDAALTPFMTQRAGHTTPKRDEG